MYINKMATLARREFLKRASGVSIAGSAAPFALNLAGLSDAAAFTATDDYKALVCVFLNGGNDFANTVIPYDQYNYNKYNSIRTGIQIRRDDLAQTVLAPKTALPGGMQLALSPKMTELKKLFDAGNLAIQLNVGPLIQPTTVAQYYTQSVPLPPALFSHSDQQFTWQTSRSGAEAYGWGGRLGDVSYENNGQSTFTCISLAGRVAFLSGTTILPYNITPNGPISIPSINENLYGSTAAANALKILMTESRQNIMENELNRITNRAIAAQQTVTAAAFKNPTPFKQVFTSTNNLAMQLQAVAKMIYARNSLSVKRQVFMVSMGGFDLHDGLTTNHPTLLAKLDEAMSQFYKATQEMGLANNVTTFTASEFGRTYASNGDGSDHGWGSHHFIMGGAVKGQEMYGIAPEVSVSGNDQVGQGRLLPTTSVDQYAATFAKWYGVSERDIPSVIPGINNFNKKNMGFL